MNHTIKYWLFFSIGIFLLLQSCNDDKSPVYEFTAAPELSPLDNSSLVLNEEAENFIAETFSWSAGKYGFQADSLPFPPVLLLLSAHSHKCKGKGYRYNRKGSCQLYYGCIFKHRSVRSMQGIPCGCRRRDR